MLRALAKSCRGGMMPSCSSSSSSSCFLISRSYHVGLDVSGFMIPHPSKAKTGGEDAFFINRGKTAFGVADGVGGWNEVGVDPALYSRALMKSAKETSETDREADSLSIMKSAYDANKETGSCTAVIAKVYPIQPNCPVSIRVSNLGDSGFFHFRQDSLLFRSTEQTWAFNAPFQLGTGSDYLPKDSDIVDLECKPGDLLVLATDGFFDNIHDQQIKEVLSGHSGLRAQQLSEGLCRLAFDASNSQNPTPFSISAKKVGRHFPGGKPDDITVVVARVFDRDCDQDDF